MAKYKFKYEIYKGAEKQEHLGSVEVKGSTFENALALAEWQLNREANINHDYGLRTEFNVVEAYLAPEKWEDISDKLK